MEYEQFFSNNECWSSTNFKLTLVGISCIALAIDCISSCRMRNRINKIKAENDTLKGIIIKAIDQKLTNILKNGYELNNSDDE